MKLRVFAVLFAGLVLLPFLAVEACGPDFRPDVFVRNLRPDQPREFAAGKLGVLLPTYPRMDLIVAFRYLNGGTLNAQEQAAYSPTYNELEPESWQTEGTASPSTSAPTPLGNWLALRKKYPGDIADINQERSFDVTSSGGFTYQSGYLNCNDDALQTAAKTLQARAQQWGENSPWLLDWIHGQDAVFANCSGATPVLPEAAPANAPALLKADRAYQSAAALFYAGKFDEARSAFAAIYQDDSSPWQGIAGYVEARCLVRQAFLPPEKGWTGQPTDFRPAPMQQAAVLLQAMQKKKHPGISDVAIEKELDLINIRIAPDAQLKKLGTALAGPQEDADYAQNLKDLTWFLDAKLDSAAFRPDVDNYQLLPAEQRNAVPLPTPTEAQRAGTFNKTYQDTNTWRDASPLTDWVLTFQSAAPEAKQHALAAWKQTHTLYWLVAAITKAQGSDPDATSLMAAATSVDKKSPAWEMVTYHRARLLLETGKADEARALIDQTLPLLQAKQLDSAVNLYRDLRMATATSLDAFLQDASQKMLQQTSEPSNASRECLEVMKDPQRSYDCAKTIDPNQLSSEAAGFLNSQAPLSVLIAAAKSPALSLQLRQSVAMMAWTRSILLQDDAAARALLPLLPAKLQRQAGTGSGLAAIMTLTRNPGLRPYLENGVQRSYTYDFVESFRDNWWCKGLAPSWAASRPPFGTEEPLFLTQAQRQQAAGQFASLKAQDGAKLYLGNYLLSYAKDHPDDKNMPEALYLVLRMIRYGCDSLLYSPDGKPTEEQQKVETLKKDVSRFLRQRYASSPWTKKAAPFAG